MITEKLRNAMDRIPDRNVQNEWMTGVYRKIHNLDAKGIAKQVYETVSPKVRREKRLAKFNEAFQKAFDEEFRELVPDIEDAMPTLYFGDRFLEMAKSYNLYENLSDYDSKIQLYTGKGPAGAA